MRFGRATATYVLAIVATLAASSADAGVARHERVKVKEIKKGKEVVGVQIDLVVMPERYSKVRIGIGPAGQIPPNNLYMPAAGNVDHGHLYHQQPELEVAQNTPTPVSFKLLYKDNPKLKPGEAFEIVSAFPQSGTSFHVYGMTRRSVNVESYTLPGGKKAATPKRKTAIQNVRRAGRKASSKQRQARQTAGRSRTSHAKPAARTKRPARSR